MSPSVGIGRPGRTRLLVPAGRAAGGSFSVAGIPHAAAFLEETGRLADAHVGNPQKAFAFRETGAICYRSRPADLPVSDEGSI